jgi:L-serine dehydratase
MVSIFELFKVGVGPSSSHTVGPMIAAQRFASSCTALEASHFASERSIDRIVVRLYGSLALTGAGHATDTAIFAGLSGCLPDRTEPDLIQSTVQRIRQTGRMQLNGILDIAFNEKSDLHWLRKETLPQHPNAIHFAVFAEGNELLFEDQYFSTGGGFVYSRQEFQTLFEQPATSSGLKQSNAAIASANVPYPFCNARELLNMCHDAQLSIEQLIQQNELVHRTGAQIDAQLDRLWSVMSDCIVKGCCASGILPGSLRVPRRAPEIFRKLSGIDPRGIDSTADAFLTQATRRGNADPLQLLDWVSLFALAVNEENAAGGRVVTAPTNGAAGIIPAVLAYYLYFYPGASRQGVYRFLKTAGAIGLLYKRNASLSAAEMGCQGEVGVACSMAAAGLAACMNGSVEQIENAAEIGMEHNLGLTCDPIGGLVQVPCIERNTMGATKAINAARLAVLYGNGKHFVSLDRVIETMRQTGVDMQVKYKETSLGGLAVNVVDC